MFQAKFVENMKTHILCSINIFASRAVCEVMWIKYRRAGQATDENRRMRFLCCIPKATDTHSEYVILTAVPLQQWLRERASLLRYTYIACLIQFKQVVYTGLL